MAVQAQNSSPGNVSYTVTSGGSEIANSFQLAHRYLHYHMLHAYLQFKLQQMQQGSDDTKQSDDADSGFLEGSASQIALSDEFNSLSIAREYFPEPLNLVSSPDDSSLGADEGAYEFIVLDHSNPDPYHHLLPPVFHSHLSTLASRLPKLILVGVQLQSQPIGFISAICSPDRTRANILSFFVKSAQRQQGLGKQLLAQMEQVLTNYGCQQVQMLYRSDMVTPALEHILRQHNWLPPRLYSLICSIEYKDFKKAAWMYRPLPASFKTFPWVELTPQQRAEIQAQRQEVLKYPPELDPFKEEDKIEPLTSVGLCYQGQVVGWMISHRVTPDTVRYSAFFVRKDLLKARCTFPLLIESIKRQKEIPGVTTGTFIVMADNTPMIRFLQRHLASSLTSTCQAWVATKLFTACQSPTDSTPLV